MLIHWLSSLIAHVQIADWLFSNGVCRPKTFDDEPHYFDKEVHFFDNEERYDQGLEFYAQRYQHCTSDETIIMDGTPNTLEQPERVRDMYAEAGSDSFSSLKIIVVLREPVSREYSLYRNKKDAFIRAPDTNAWFGDIAFANGTVMSFEQYSENVLKEQISNRSWKSTGKYIDHVRRWVRIFLFQSQVIRHRILF